MINYDHDYAIFLKLFLIIKRRHFISLSVAFWLNKVYSVFFLHTTKPLRAINLIFLWGRECIEIWFEWPIKVITNQDSKVKKNACFYVFFHYLFNVASFQSFKIISSYSI